jgi:translation elongation factor EF-Ts
MRPAKIRKKRRGAITLHVQTVTLDEEGNKNFPKITAIIGLRDITDFGLKDAKEFIELCLDTTQPVVIYKNKSYKEFKKILQKFKWVMRERGRTDSKIEEETSMPQHTKIEFGRTDGIEFVSRYSHTTGLGYNVSTHTW